MHRSRRCPRIACRGFTLTEVMIVVVIAGVITLGLVVFYLNAQVMWTDASTQVMAQRDATLLIEAMRRSGHVADSAVVDSEDRRVIFIDSDADSEICRFFWDPSVDDFVHMGIWNDPDVGRVNFTTVESFRVSYDPAIGVVSIDTLRLRSSNGHTVQMSSAIGLYNR